MAQYLNENSCLTNFGKMDAAFAHAQSIQCNNDEFDGHT